MNTVKQITPNTNGYRNIHKRVRNKFGKAYRCENQGCLGNSTRFDWALKRGCEYSMNKDDYQMLCRSCHMIQDSAKGEKQSAAKLTEEQVRYIKRNPDNLTATELAKRFGVIRQTVSLIINNVNWKHIQI